MATPYWNNTPVVQGNVIQGHIVQTHNDGGYKSKINDHEQQEPQATPYTSQWTKEGEHQPRRCQDAIWAILFYAHLAVMAILAATCLPQMLATVADGDQQRRLMKLRFLEEQEEDMVVDLDGMLWIVSVCGVAAFVLSTLALGFMIRFSEILIKTALLFNVVLTGLFSVLALLQGNLLGGMIALFMFGLMAYYAFVVWSRIPFAATNLITASTAIRANMGLSFYAYLSLLISLLWSIGWTAASVSTTFVVHECDFEGECQKEISTLFVFLMALSYYWTIGVIGNVVHVTVAGTVATWWFAPLEANGCFSKAVRDSYVRSMTYSFGSICLGSLIVAIIQALREIVNQARESGDSLIMCIAECILSCIESIVEYFNKWAYVFVGIYGYGFMEAGKNVITLFRHRGWTTIITDDLVDKTLLMVSIGIGILNGILGTLLSVYFDGMGAMMPFIIGFILGFALSSILFKIVSSGVATVIVCYAEAPAEFQNNHTELSEQMRSTWRQAWPTEFQY